MTRVMRAAVSVLACVLALASTGVVHAWGPWDDLNECVANNLWVWNSEEDMNRRLQECK